MQHISEILEEFVKDLLVTMPLEVLVELESSIKAEMIHDLSNSANAMDAVEATLAAKFPNPDEITEEDALSPEANELNERIDKILFQHATNTIRNSRALGIVHTELKNRQGVPQDDTSSEESSDENNSRE